MGRPPFKRRGVGRGGNKSATDQKGSSSGGTGKYRAPTVGYEDCIFSHGDTKDAAVFTATLTKLARMVALKSWAGATVAGRAMERMKEPTLVEPTMAAVLYVGKEEYVDELSGVTRTRDKNVAKDPSMIARDQGIWMIHYKQWIVDSAAWETNRAKIFALVLEHCPPDLEEVLKTLSSWVKVHDEQDAIDLLKMVRNVALDQTETKQTVMSYVESSYELFTFHQDKHPLIYNVYTKRNHVRKYYYSSKRTRRKPDVTLQKFRHLFVEISLEKRSCLRVNVQVEIIVIDIQESSLEFFCLR